MWLLAIACARRDSQAEVAAALADLQLGEERDVGHGMFFLMHRNQVYAPGPDGWQTATSTGGGFSVELPLPFNDFRMRGAAADEVEVRTWAVGGKSPGLLAWTATCMMRRDGTLAGGAGAPSDTTSFLGAAEQRVVQSADAVCTLIVEAQGSDPLPPAADRTRFLQSLKRTGPPSWE